MTPDQLITVDIKGNKCGTEAMLFLGKVVEAEYATPTTAALGITVAAVAGEHNTIILPHHGAVVLGKTIWDAYSNLEVLEFAAKVNYLVYSMDGDKPIAREYKKEILDVREKYRMTLPSDKGLLD
nr:class II aldolase/adducin family protein [uncultured Vibrio sp.]|eukprot:Anaeramoba_ignava/a98906_15.p1 GENE.a98906_15~~a98906_15.p1  ORF type:complete len:125 (+),score=4.94 a98906_15:391-765(+)